MKIIRLSFWLIVILSALFAVGGCKEKTHPEPPPKVENSNPPVATLPAGYNAMRKHQLYDLQKAELMVNGKALPVYIMDTDSKREEGMMHIADEKVDSDIGMIFVFSKPQPLSFWMKNTAVALDIAYIDAEGKVLNTSMMIPYDETSIPSAGSCLYALEMKAGSFKLWGIKAGVKIKIPSDIKAKELP